MSTLLSDKVALVTGSSRGIGRAIALHLAQNGADVAIHYLRKKQAAHSAVADIEALGRKAIAVRANLAQPDAAETIAQAVTDQLGRCDILVGNAASGTTRDVLDIEPKHWDWTMNINARSILELAQQLAPGMKAAGWGRIVTITSPGSQRVLPHYSTIGLSKAVVEALTRYLAADLAPYNISVNAVSPGLVATEALDAFPVDLQNLFETTLHRTPAQRLVTPTDVAQVVTFLCSDAAQMIVGQTITVDGGYSILA